LRFWTFLGWPLIVVPVVIDYFGAFLNQLVIATNRGTFPVLAPNCTIKTSFMEVHTCMTPDSHLKFLADWISLGNIVASPGDLLLWLADAIQGPCFYVWLAVILFMALQYQRVSRSN